VSTFCGTRWVVGEEAQVQFESKDVVAQAEFGSKI
jgi:hypothetical protein